MDDIRVKNSSSCIHATALVHPDAKIGSDVVVGPYAIVGPGVVLEDRVKVNGHAIVEGNTTIGQGTVIFSHAVVGGEPQDKKFSGEKDVSLVIGKENLFREFTTIHVGTSDGGGKTRIGDNNLFMAYSHVAHDCVVGNNCVMANSGTLAGHVTLEDHVVVGGLTAIHQFVRLGCYSIVGGCSKVVQDIPPYSMCDGHPARVYSLNLVGLRRVSIDNQIIKRLKEAFKILFHSGLSKAHALEKIEAEIEMCPELKHLLDFVRSSQRGLCN